MKKDNYFIHFILIIIYRLLLDYAYFNEIVVNYSYYGFKDYRNTTYQVISWLVLLAFSIPIIRLLKKKISFSNTILFLLTLLSIVPFTTLIYSGALNTRFIIMNCIYWIVFITLYGVIFRKEISPIIFKYNNMKFDNKIALTIGLLSIILVLFISWKYTGLRLNLNLNNVYDIRMEARTYRLPTILQYLFEWSRSINIILLAYSLTKKKYFASICFIIAQTISFGIDGLKSSFLMTIVTLVFMIFYKEKYISKFKRICLYGFTGISLLGVLEKILFKTGNLIELFIRRMLILPIYLNSYYVDFFSKNVPDFFKRSFLRIFGFVSSYPDLEFQIGKLYLNRPLMRCNNGLISDAVTNFGTVGIIVGPLILVLVLIFMDRCTFNTNKKICLITALYFATKLIDSFLTVGLFTHGLFISLIIMTMIKENTEKQ